MKAFFLFLTLLFLNVSQAQQVSTSEAKKTYKDIRQTLGIVPTFMKNFPEEGIGGAWEDMKGLQLNPNTKIPGKYKELIGIAVSAQIPCRYCVYFHTQAAILNGATQREIGEAVALAANTRRWSTIISGTQIDLIGFKTDVDQMHSFLLKQKTQQAMEERPAMMEMKTAEDAYKDMQQTFGFVPTFFKNYPKSSVAGAWKEMKSVELNPKTAIPPKYKELIGLSVASQIPCAACTYFHTQTAFLYDVTKEELQEAVAMAGVTREWSTVLNGHHTDEKVFREEVDQIIKFLKSRPSKEVTSR